MKQNKKGKRYIRTRFRQICIIGRARQKATKSQFVSVLLARCLKQQRRWFNASIFNAISKNVANPAVTASNIHNFLYFIRIQPLFNGWNN